MAGPTLAAATVITRVFDPLTLSDVGEVTLRASRMKRLRRVSSFAYYNAQAAREVLRKPDALFWGVRPTAKPGYGWCYVGRPQRLWLSDTLYMPFPEGFVFTAYVDAKGFLFEWGLERADQQQPDFPADYLSGRFGELKWRNTN